MTGIEWMPNKAQIIPLSHPWVNKEEGETVSSWVGLAEAPEDCEPSDSAMWQQQQEVTVPYISLAFHCSQEHGHPLFYLPHSVLLGFTLCVDTAGAGPLAATAVGWKCPVVFSLDPFSFSLVFPSQFSQSSTLLQCKLLCSF